MATNSSSPNSSPSATSPASTSPPPQPSSPPPAASSPPPAASSPPPAASTTPPSSQPKANPPDAVTPPPSPPPQSSPANNATSPPPASQSVPPPQPASPLPTANSPPTAPPPKSASPPPPNVPSPSSNSTSPPPANPPSSPPPPSSNPPATSPPPPSANPPATSPPPPSPNPPASSPPPPSSEPPKNSPPPTPSKPPTSSPPPQASQPPENSPPPPSSKPPEGSPPPPASKPPKNSPPPPASSPPENSPPPQASVPPNAPPPPPGSTSSSSPPSSNSPPKAPPPSIMHLSPPPPSSSPASLVPIPPLGNPPTNNSSTNAPEKSNSTGGLGTGGAVAIALVLGFVLLSVIGTAAWCIRRRKKKVSGLDGGYIMPTSVGSSPKSESALLKAQASSTLVFGSGSGSDCVHTPSQSGGLGNSRSWFTYEELVEATNGFSEQNLLGEGGFGSVYKGYLGDGREVAVKKLKIGGGQGEREFKAEVEIISRIHHRHLVSLVGYCISENQRLLVYDYVSNNTLYFHLHGKDRPVMDWTTRVKIAAGSARGIAYLHEDCHPRIIHRDIKSANILLDNNFDARVSDFGLAKLALDANTHVTTRVMGTFGYMAPEYAQSGKLTEKSDVYSFGVVLLELITGRKPVDQHQPMGEESLVEWARPLLSQALDTEEFEGLADPRLGKNYVDSEMFLMMEAAAACVRHSAAKRPRMGQVVRAFDGMATADITNGMRLGESEIFNSAQQSAEIRLFQRMAFGSQNYSTDFFSENSFNNNHERAVDILQQDESFLVRSGNFA